MKIRGREEYPFYFGAKPEMLMMAADLRKTMTSAEKAIWEKLRNRQMLGYRFRRQHPINQFIVDFFCYEKMLVIEIDGEVHDDSHQKERDMERRKILKGYEIRELRFKNSEVQNNIGDVIQKIIIELKSS